MRGKVEGVKGERVRGEGWGERVRSVLQFFIRWHHCSFIQGAKGEIGVTGPHGPPGLKVLCVHTISGCGLVVGVA